MLASRQTLSSVLSLCLAALFLCCAPGLARADIVVTVGSSSAPIGGTGSFDVNINNIGGSSSFQVSGFSVELMVAASSGITFKSADVSTTSGYIFGTLQAPPITFSGFPNTDFIASDSSQTSPFFTTLNVGDHFGLLHVSYSVASSATTGPFTVSILGIGTTSQILDLSGNLIPFTPTNGTITLTAVPEPSSLLLLSTALIVPVTSLARRRLARRALTSPGKVLAGPTP
jgi:hypothetical protein